MKVRDKYNDAHLVMFKSGQVLIYCNYCEEGNL